MAISEYKPTKRYDVGMLKPHVLLLPIETTLIDYEIDNGQCRIKGINASTIIKVEGLSASYSSEETLQGRFKFNNSLVLNVPEKTSSANFPELSQLVKGNWLTVFETKSGIKLMQSVDLGVEPTYSYSFTNQTTSANLCAITFRSQSNIPTMILDNVSIEPTQTLIMNDCNYNVGRVNKLEICNWKNVLTMQDDGGKFSHLYTNNGEIFNEVKFDSASFNYTETYDENVFTQTLTFTIPLSDYKYYWHYNLIEFTKNRYTILFHTECDNVVLGGFDYGFTPTYTMASAEGNTSMDTITITMRHSSETISAQSKEGEYVIEVDTRTLLTPVDNIYDNNGNKATTIVCINETTGAYVLFEEVTLTGDRTGKYWCLEGYENAFNWLNIVGTYTLESDIGYPITFQSQECATVEECEFTSNPPSIINFTQKGEINTYPIQGTCDWVIVDIPSWLEVSTTEGDADILYNVSFKTLVDPPTDGYQDELHLQYGMRDYIIKVNYGVKSSWIDPIVFNITAAEQQCVSSFMNYSTYAPYSYSNLSEGISQVVMNSVGTTAYVMENTDEENPRTLTYNVTNKNGESVTVIINQDRLYTTLVKVDGVLCDGNNSYERIEKYKGYTSNQINIPTGIYSMGDIVMVNDPQCQGSNTQWRDTGMTLCIGSDEYKEEEQYISTDNGQSWVSTGVTRTGALVESNSPTCDSRYQWGVSGQTICIATNKFQILEKIFTQDDGTTILTGEQKVGELIEINAEECSRQYNHQWIFCVNTPGFTSGDCIENYAHLWSVEDFTVSWSNGEWITYNNTKSDFDVEVDKKCFADYKSEHSITVSGNVNKIVLKGRPEISCFFVVNWEGTDGGNTQEILINPEFEGACTVSKWDLSKFNLLSKLVIHNHAGKDGITEFVVNPIFFSYLEISNDDDNPTYITSEQLTAIVDALPNISSNTTKGYVSFCNLKDSNGDNLACSAIDNAKAAELLAKGWYYNQECCEVEGAKKYQLVENADRYYCENFTKFKYMSIYVSTFTNGAWSEWEDTGEIIKGEAFEYNSVDCGYVLPVLEEWRQDGGRTYVCDGYDKYSALIKYISTDGGKTYVISNPPEIKKSDMLMEANSEDCGYSSTDRIERWVAADGYICSFTGEGDQDDCWWQNLWTPFGFNDQTHQFEAGLVNSLPEICNGDEFTSGDNMFTLLQVLAIFPVFNTNNMKTAKNMFKNCLNIKETSVYKFEYNFASLTDATSMLENCPKLTSVSKLDMPKCKIATNMFKGDNGLLTIDFNGCNSLESVNGIINGCTNLTSITNLNLSGASGRINISESSTRMQNLQTLEVSGLNNCTFVISPFQYLERSSLKYMIENSGSGCTIEMSEAINNRIVDTVMKDLATRNNVTLYVDPNYLG